MHLTEALAAWRTPDFESQFKAAVKRLDPDLLPLQQGLSHSSRANADSLGISLLGISDTQDRIQIKAGLFYTGIVAGCSCADDPTPVDEINEYCEVLFDIDRATGETKVTLLAD